MGLRQWSLELYPTNNPEDDSKKAQTFDIKTYYVIIFDPCFPFR